MSELCPAGRSEGYEIRDDEVARRELRPATQILRAGNTAKSRPCLKNVNMPKRRVFSRHTALIFLAIQKVLPRQIALSDEKIPRRWSHFQFSNKA